jgi:hypothetical protein
MVSYRACTLTMTPVLKILDICCIVVWLEMARQTRKLTHGSDTEPAAEAICNCATVVELPHWVGQAPAVASLRCTPGEVISKIVFASFGIDHGFCGNYKVRRCHSQRSQAVVEKACLGKSSCQITVSTSTFEESKSFCNADPIGPSLDRELAVEVRCSRTYLPKA